MSALLRCALLCALAIAAFSLPTAAQADFGFEPGTAGFSAFAENKSAGAANEAGMHPYALKARVGLNTVGGASDGDLRNLRISLPTGLLVNPSKVNECSAAAFGTPRVSPYEATTSGENCPNSSQVGVIAVNIGGTTRHFGLFNLAPPFGSAAAFGASPFGTPLVFKVRLREGDSGLDLVLEDLSKTLDLQSFDLTVWGTPWEGTASPGSGHNPQRGNCLNELTGGSNGTCLVQGSSPAPESQIKSYLTLPTTPCGLPPAFTAAATSWQGDNASADSTIASLIKCNKALTKAKVQLMTDVAAARTGMAFNLDINDGGGILNPGGIARPAIKQAIVSLPEGLTINPSLGSGLGVCDEAQFARESATSEPGAGCPNNSKIGTVTADGILGLDESLQGSLWVSRPYANPFNSLLAVYMLARLPKRGLIVKSVGKLEPDPKTGRLTATFDNLPRLLYTHFGLTLREGQRSTLVSPSACGAYPTSLQLASWAEPNAFTPDSSAFSINHGEAGGPCSGGIQPFNPGLLAGSINPTAAAFTPFYLRMTRSDSEQEITGYSATFPPGLLAKIAGVTTCSDAAIEAAKAKSGQAELASPSCPASSEIGHTIAGYGVGGTLAYAPGALYLGGPYHGAPLSTVAIDSATIGPFDLGVVVVRSAIRINPRTAQASIDSAGSDPIPHILAGIPLHLRDIRVSVDRPNFTRNPTSCDPLAVSSALTGAGADIFNSADDSAAVSTQRFQVLNCTLLGFKPRLGFRIKGGSRRGAYPSLKATYVPRPGDANLGAVSVTLPPAVFLAQNHIRTVCTRVQFRKDNCPAESIYGKATATTPLMDEPLSGPVYLRASDHPVPDLVASLKGRGIEIEVPARIDRSRGGIRANFDNLPDAPVTKFTLTMQGGKKGVLQLGGSLCAKEQRTNARFIAQSNATEVVHPVLKAKCSKHKGKGRKAR